MAVEKDFELLDDYLSNRLNGANKMAFEKKLEADPELKQEFKIQQDLTEGIRKARTVELKSMLNNLPVAPIQGGQPSMLIKAGSWVVIAGLVATGVYVYFVKNDSPEVVKEPVTVEQPKTKTVPPAEVESKESEPIKENEVPGKEVEKLSDKKPAETSVTSEPAKKPELKAYDPSKEESAEATRKYEHEQLEIISKAFITSSTEVETVSSNKKYRFHYLFKDGKLVLYGVFEKHLYEILEFISDKNEKHTVVLFYKADYYLLDITKSTPTVLSPIKDRTLLKKLSEYRGN